MNFNETEWEFLAAIEALEYLNFDTSMEPVRDDAAKIATVIVNRSRANSQLVTALVEALRPFAALDYNDTWAVIVGDPPLVGCSLRLSDIESARAALALHSPPPTQLPLEHAKVKAEREDGL